MNVYAPGITMGKFLRTENAIQEGLAEEFYQYKMEGSEVSADMSSGSRVGAFFIQGKEVKDIYNKISGINNIIEVLDNKGNAVMRHDIYNL